MAHYQPGPVEYRLDGGGYRMDRMSDSSSNGTRPVVPRFWLQAGPAMGRASFANLFPLSLAVPLSSLLHPKAPDAGWKFPARGPAKTGREPRRTEYRTRHKRSQALAS